MKIAVISDIHANLEALSTVLKDIYTKKVDMIISLGDIVGYGPNPNECIQLIEEHTHQSLMGNHDAAVFNPIMARDFNDNARFAIEWSNKALNKASKKYLRSLPMSFSNEHLTALHSTPYDPHLWYYISSLEDAKFNFNFFHTRVCFIGHTHIPGIILYNESTSEISIIKANAQLELNNYKDYRFIVNVGSIGQPRDRNSDSCYVVFDTDKMTIDFPRISYDIDTYQNKMRDIEMPEFLVNRVKEGR
jgi:predicted phosphodiesterase